MKKLKKILKILLISILGLVAVLFTAKLIIDKDLPTGEEGEKAEILAQKMLKAINQEAWDSTVAVKWNFGGRHQLLWDRKRNLAKVEWGGKTVLVNCDTREGIAFHKGERLKNAEKENELVEDGFAWWANDAYWLNPVSKIYDDGVVRKYVKTKEGEETLLVTFQSGGVTPGDSYLWYLDETGLPIKWEMWVSVIPIKGVSTSWEGWKESETGAKYASSHGMGPLSFEITDVEMTHNINLWYNEDPFYEIAND